jgi:YrbI family 3-deoxy-D-manno-octulosonate 8-phosphate phosphatase
MSKFNSLPNSNLPKIIFTDFDGCLTNDTVKINSFGREKVVVNRKDGLAVKRLRKLGIEVVIVSAETNDVVLHRAKKMKVEALRGVEDKVNTISKYLDKRAISWSEVWYLGNDINDLGAMSKAQISFCPLDASPEIFSQAKVVLSRRGGEGLLAEIASRLEKN